MKIKTITFLELTIPLFFVFLLSGCFGDGGSSATYDGIWTVGFTDSSFVKPAAATGAVVSCTVQYPMPQITIAEGIGSTTQTNTCTGTAAPGGTENFIYLISVSINIPNGITTAIVNGSTLTGKCISPIGCAAQAGTQSLSLTR
jgi:hypothetical protein